MKILFATHNSNKVAEARRIFRQSGWEVLSLPDIGLDVQFIESDRSYRDNALGKARLAFEQCRMWTIGEDSGLEIDALDGKPGVLSARFGGQETSYWECNRRILKMMSEVPEPMRTARFRCVVCLIGPEDDEIYFEGVCPGTIADSIRGTQGFGYDPIFIPDGYFQTFAELGSAVKDLISHRSRALRQVIDYLILRVQSR